MHAASNTKPETQQDIFTPTSTSFKHQEHKTDKNRTKYLKNMKS